MGRRFDPDGAHMKKVRTIENSIIFGVSRMAPIKDQIDKNLDILNAAYEFGIRSFETSDSYLVGDAERMMGVFLKSKKDIKIYSKTGKKLNLLNLDFANFRNPSNQYFYSKYLQIYQFFKNNVGQQVEEIFIDNLDYAHLDENFQKTLSRIRCESIFGYFLHGLPRNENFAIQLISDLKKLKSARNIKEIGVTLYEPPKIDLSEIDSIQIPFFSVDKINNFSGVIIARGVFRETNLENKSKICEALFEKEKTKIVFDTTNLEHFKINSEKIFNAIQKINKTEYSQ